jgi:hypothetical protein
VVPRGTILSMASQYPANVTLEGIWTNPYSVDRAQGLRFSPSKAKATPTALVHHAQHEFGGQGADDLLPQPAVENTKAIRGASRKQDNASIIDMLQIPTRGRFRHEAIGRHSSVICMISL